MDVISVCDGFNTHHIGTLRCRQEGASTPSTEPCKTTKPHKINRALQDHKTAQDQHHRGGQKAGHYRKCSMHELSELDPCGGTKDSGANI
jgi:hypothetical protein